MKILVLNESDSGGGAAIAARRLAEALKKHTSHEVIFKVRRGSEEYKFQTSAVVNFVNRVLKFFEKKALNFLKVDNHDLLNMDSFNVYDASREYLNQINKIDPDIINLHWINNGFLSINQIDNLAKKYKILWTLHDMWPILGIEHYERSLFQDVNRGKVFKFLNKTVFDKKKKLYNNNNIHFACISKWMYRELRNRLDIAENRIHIIPNTYGSKLEEKFKCINTDSGNSTKKFVLLQSSKSSDTDYRKGFELLKQVLKNLENENIELRVLGCKEDRKYKVGSVEVNEYKSTDKEEIVIEHYMNADLHICSSRLDNYPNTILEASSLGVPTIAFNVGGISDMIDHNNTGKLIKPFSIKSMANEIRNLSINREKLSLYNENLEKQKEQNSGSSIAYIFEQVIKRIQAT